MKSLKITLLAIFSVVLLTGVSQSNDTTPVTDNHEVRKAEINLTAMHKKKGSQVPTQG